MATATVIDPSARLKGRLSGEGDANILGSLEGDVQLKGNVAVGAVASVKGNSIQAAHVQVEGNVQADVTAEGSVNVLSGGNLAGVVKAPAFHVQAGAELAVDVQNEFELPPELMGGLGRSLLRRKQPSRATGTVRTLSGIPGQGPRPDAREKQILRSVFASAPKGATPWG